MAALPKTWSAKLSVVCGPWVGFRPKAYRLRNGVEVKGLGVIAEFHAHIFVVRLPFVAIGLYLWRFA